MAELLPVSASSDDALNAHLTRLAAGIAKLPLADLAHTLQTGRAELGHRRAVVATDTADAAARLIAASALPGVRRTPERPSLAFLLPGVGDQYRGLGHALYRSEPVFAAAVDECLAVTDHRCGVDLRPVLFTEPEVRQDDAAFLGRTGSTAAADDLLEHAEIAHPFLFTVEYALATLLAHRGVHPDLLVGYSLGEYVAACLAGVFTCADALWVLTERARLIGSAPAGRMLAVAADEQQLGEVLASCSAPVDTAAVNGPGMTVLSGTPNEIETVAEHLARAGIAARPLRSAHPFHSTLLRPAQEKLAEVVASVDRHPPRIPVISNTTGAPLTDEQAIDPQYWAAHLCLPVRFADAVRHCAGREIDAYVELGPGQTLGSLVRQNIPGGTATVLGTLPAPWTASSTSDRPDENVGLLETCGRLWESGVTLDWSAFRPRPGQLVDLPPYPFQRTPFWPEARKSEDSRPSEAPAAGLCYAPVWRPDLTRLLADSPDLSGTLVVFADEGGIGTRLADRAEAAGAQVVEVVAGTEHRRAGRKVVIDPTVPEHYREVVAAAAGTGCVRVVHLWSLSRPAGPRMFADDAERRAAVRGGFDSLLLAVQALGELAAERGVRLLTVSAGAAEITGGDVTAPDQAIVHGLGRGVRGEHPGLAWRGLDLQPGAKPEEQAGLLVEELRREPWEYHDPAAEPALVGWRNGRRWLKCFAEVPLAEATENVWDVDGTYLITGGTRGLGMILAKHLVRRGVRRLALIGRTDPRRAPRTDRTARSLRDVAELEAAGAQVLLLTADAGVPDELRAALRAAREHFGALDGVVHAAGVAGSGLAQRQTVTGAGRTLAPKVLAMGPLAELVGPDTPAELRPGLLVMYSSVVTVVGGLGEGDYCAANSVLDACGAALATAAPDTRVITVAWGPWQHDDWQHEASGDGLAERAAYRRRQGFTDEAGCALLDRLIGDVGNGVNGAVVALRQRLPEAMRELTALNDLDVLTSSAKSNAGSTKSARFPRPPLRTGYAAPRSALETTIAEVWGDYLGIDRVGIHDPFFDLGGNSLVGMAMVTAIERLLDRQIAPAVLFGHPTVATFTSALEETGETSQGNGASTTAGAARGERRRRAGGARTTGTHE